MINYVYIWNKQLRVPLKTTPDNPFILSFGNYSLQFATAADESLYAFCIYNEDTTYLSYLLKNIFRDYNLTVEDIDTFIDCFKEAHEAVSCRVLLKDVPCLTEPGESFQIGNYLKTPIVINHETEKHIVDIMCITNDRRDRSSNDIFIKENGVGYEGLVHAFYEYCNKYGIETNYKKDMKDMPYLLADEFCYYHGVKAEQLAKSFEVSRAKLFSLTGFLPTFIICTLIWLFIAIKYEAGIWGFFFVEAAIVYASCKISYLTRSPFSEE